MRVVFDTNIYIAAALNPGKYADHWLRVASARQQIELVTSPAILTELAGKLEGEKLRLPRSEVVAFISGIEAIATVVRPTRVIKRIKADPDDNKILECAVEAGADLIISNDPHLIKLREFEGIGIAHASSLKHIFPEN